MLIVVTNIDNSRSFKWGCGCIFRGIIFGQTTGPICKQQRSIEACVKIMVNRCTLFFADYEIPKIKELNGSVVECLQTDSDYPDP